MERVVAVGCLFGRGPDLATLEVGMEGARHESHEGLLHRHLDLLALARLFPLVERRANRQCERDAGCLIADAHGLDAWHPRLLLRCVLPAGHGHDRARVRPYMGIWPVLAVAAAARVDDPGIDLAQR